MTFNDLGLRSQVVKAVTDMGFEQPTPIQQEAIPHLLKSKSDFVGLAQTGTGKTAAFGLPLVNRITESRKFPTGLIICPTRELCLQIAKDIGNYAKHEKAASVEAVYGGSDIQRQIKNIKRGVSIIVATPGRLCDLIKRKAVKLDEVEVVVLDEADEMLNMGFKEDLDFILSATPEEKSTWLFSATMPKEVARIGKTYMTDPLEVSIGNKNEGNANIDHIYFAVKERDRYVALKRLIDFNPKIFGLVFCRTRRETQQVAEKLGKEGYSAEALHGDLSQAQRDRVMNLFRNRSIQLLVATDVAARGIDVDDITHVINYNLPDEVENYTHRSGRTARAGNTGESLVLINTREKYKIKQIEKIIKQEFTFAEIPPAEAICAVQLESMIDKVKATKVNEAEIAPFIPHILEDLEELSKEEVIKKFVSAEFNRFLDYYKKAGDLNAKPSDRPGDDRGSKRRGRREGTDENKQRFFVSLGEKDGLNPGGLLRVICDATGLKSNTIGRIDIMPAFSFFDADKTDVDKILSQVKGAEFEGKTMNIEKTENKSAKGRKGRGGGGRSRGNDRRSGGRDRRGGSGSSRRRR
ncbi:ATP-dependent RNA helicase [Brumimicrobium salinarum]|uniref:ATP-dependent RNA helicase n=1 Tax=Brumimicrobium salinarum TaxID=2058658 RepID=A0A2I0R0T9_9FLAO|nr:DEAD/DEAH box helicase [Brumimicrobium salinarum]PKR80202.1 ATP-dependent RNA helicase [Brumimicrobium salinarum]